MAELTLEQREELRANRSQRKAAKAARKEKATGSENALRKKLGALQTERSSSAAPGGFEFVATYRPNPHGRTNHRTKQVAVRKEKDFKALGRPQSVTFDREVKKVVEVTDAVSGLTRLVEELYIESVQRKETKWTFQQKGFPAHTFTQKHADTEVVLSARTITG